MIKPNDLQIAKQAAGKAAAALIQEGMIVGLGTGSTAAFFIDSLIDRCRSTGLKIRVVATSEDSAQRARAGGIIVEDPNEITSIDFTVDGADEIDKQKRMIKGGGGALLRETVIASLSREMIVIVDETKLVETLGRCPLPLEVIPFAHRAIFHKIQQLGYQGKLRLNNDGSLYKTDNANYIIDITFENRQCDPLKDQMILKNIPGILETGFFLGMAGRVIIGYGDGTTKILA